MSLDNVFLSMKGLSIEDLLVVQEVQRKLMAEVQSVQGLNFNGKQRHVYSFTPKSEV